jgi:hypothetical protein
MRRDTLRAAIEKYEPRVRRELLAIGRFAGPVLTVRETLRATG